MGQRRHHYERAFEGFLRARRIPYVSVDEARRALVPPGLPSSGPTAQASGGALKSFDFVVYGASGSNLLVDIKGRRVAPGRSRTANGPSRWSAGRLETWVTLEDVESLGRWRDLFGEGFNAAFVFIFQCDAQPPDALFQEIMEFDGAWYALRAVMLDAYRAAMRPRSPRWGTVYVPGAAFSQISQPFAPSAGFSGSSRASDLMHSSASPDWGPETPAFLPHGADEYHHP